jgi:hypothetical protein
VVLFIKAARMTIAPLESVETCFTKSILSFVRSMSLCRICSSEWSSMVDLTSTPLFPPSARNTDNKDLQTDGTGKGNVVTLPIFEETEVIVL